MTFLTVDIETVPQARFVDPEQYALTGPMAGPISLDDSLLQVREGWREEHYHVSFAEIATAIREARVPLGETGVAASLHPTTCHIVQVSFGWRAPMGNQPAELHRKVLQINDYFLGPERSLSDAERPLVYDAIDLLAGAYQKGTTIVSFNGKQFDIPVLRARAALLRAKVPPIPWRRLLYPYADDRHADLRLILSADDRRARGTLQWWCDAFGIRAEEHGSDVFTWVRNCEWDKLYAYGLVEAQTLVELYEAVRPVL